jgi:hypothetical protein
MKHENVQFTVTIYAGDAALSFEGIIKIGGDSEKTNNKATYSSNKTTTS